MKNECYVTCPECGKFHAVAGEADPFTGEVWPIDDADATCAECRAKLAPREFFVSVADGKRNRFLLGPYPTHAAALENVARGRKLACDADDRAWFYSYGTSSAVAGTVTKTIFGS